MENTIYPDGAIFMLFVENDVMPNLETKEPRFYDIIGLFKENGQTVQSLDRGVNLPIINDSLLF